MFGVLAYFAVLAYPESLNSRDRENFRKALHSWRCKNVRNDLVYWERLSAEIRQMTNRSIRGKLHMGLKRIEKRLKAGFIAHKISINDRAMPSSNPTARSGIGLVVGCGADTVTEGLLEILREENPHRSYDQHDIGVRSAIEDLRRVIWTDSLPVLHIATSLEFILCGLSPDVPRWALVHRLLHDPRWLPDTLANAEWWRRYLVSPRIPGFDKDKAIRLIPAN